MKVKDMVEFLSAMNPEADLIIYNPYCNNCGHNDDNKDFPPEDCEAHGHFLDVDYIDHDEDQVEIICK